MFFGIKRCDPKRSFCIRLCSLLMLNPRERSRYSVFTIPAPRVINLVNPISCFVIPNTPSAWIDRLIRSRIPSSDVIFRSLSLRYSSNFGEPVFSCCISLCSISQDRDSRCSHCIHIFWSQTNIRFYRFCTGCTDMSVPSRFYRCNGHSLDHIPWRAGIPSLSEISLFCCIHDWMA